FIASGEQLRLSFLSVLVTLRVDLSDLDLEGLGVASAVALPFPGVSFFDDDCRDLLFDACFDFTLPLVFSPRFSLLPLVALDLSPSDRLLFLPLFFFFFFRLLFLSAIVR